jgi:anti-anti-sigma factor
MAIKPENTAVESEVHDNILIIKISGQGIDSLAITRIRDIIRTNLDDGIKNFIFDFKGMTWMRNADLAVIIGADATITRLGGRMVLSGITEKVESIFTTTKLISHFSVYDDFEKAIIALNAL